MKIAGIIPARYASTRFPGKPLVLIGGVPMILRVYQQALKATALAEVVVATDDSRILEVIRNAGGKAVLTASHHANGTARCAEVAEQLEVEGIINIQGDEPFVSPELLNAMANRLAMGDAEVVTPVKQQKTDEGYHDPSRVKVVCSQDLQAFYFSRSPIPFFRNPGEQDYYWKHIGLYGFRKEVLARLSALPESPLERAEMLEQLRWMEAGVKIHCIETLEDSLSIDTPQDLEQIPNKWLLD